MLTLAGTRRPFGVPEIDAMLNGGFPTGAAILLAGNSGAGKTILCTQWLFAGLRLYNEPGIFISMTEPVVKAVGNASNMGFFDRKLVSPLQVHFTDLRAVMKGMDLDNQDFTKADILKLVNMIRNMAERSGAKRIVLDSVTAMAYRLKDKDLIRDFIFQLGTMLGQLDANVIMTSEVAGDGYSVFGVEEFISDGIIKMSFVRDGENEPYRRFEIAKMRGTRFNPHPALYRVTSDGIKLYPYIRRELPGRVSDERLASGVEGLDKMTAGGILDGSSVLLTGASGTGKTVLTLQMLAQALKLGRKCIYVSLEESHDQLVKNAAAFGWDLEQYRKSGLLQIIALYPEQKYLDELFIDITRQVDVMDAKFMVVDSLTALANTYPERLVRDFASRLVSYMKGLLVTCVFTHASEAMMGSMGVSESFLSSQFDMIILLRFVEIQSSLRHGVTILKMRRSVHDSALREFEFTTEGIRVTTDFSGYEGILRGETRKAGDTIEEKLRAMLVGIFGQRGEAILQREKAKGLSLDHTRKLLKELGNEGVISARRQQDLLSEIERAMGGSTRENPRKL